ncbi:MAG: DUF883 domain-containing protein [Tatlockia sp.]|nr:DUF883 domain-containing protein [Tatlockia sp.]
MSDLNQIKNDAKSKASNLYNEGKKEAESLAAQLANGASDLYEEGKKRVGQFEDTVCDYSDELVSKVKERPLTSLLVAGGVGFIMSLLLKK